MPSNGSASVSASKSRSTASGAVLAAVPEAALPLAVGTAALNALRGRSRPGPTVTAPPDMVVINPDLKGHPIGRPKIRVRTVKGVRIVEVHQHTVTPLEVVVGAAAVGVGYYLYQQQKAAQATSSTPWYGFLMNPWLFWSNLQNPSVIFPKL